MRVIALPLLALGLSGCAVLHSNVRGGFSCAAPRGTCAPSTAIDDSALKSIDAADHKPHEADPQSAPSAGRAALRVVYPAWRDTSGRVHKRTVAYVNVDAPGVAPVEHAPFAAGSTQGANLLALAESAPELAPSPGAPDSTPAPTRAPSPIGAIEEQVHDILAKAPRPAKAGTAKPPLPGAASAPSAPPPAPPINGGTQFPPAGE